MSIPVWIRWSGLSLLLGGISIIAFVVIHPQSEFTPEVMTKGIAKVAHNLHFLGAALIAFGLVGLHLRQMEKAGKLGVVGFTLAFFGAIWFAGLGLLSFDALPFMAAHAPDLVAKDGPFWTEAPSPLFIVGLLCYLVGFITLGISVIRAKVLPRWTGYPLIPGAVVGILPPTVVPIIVLTVGGVLLGIGVCGMGYALWRTPASKLAKAPAS